MIDIDNDKFQLIISPYFKDKLILTEDFSNGDKLIDLTGVSNLRIKIVGDNDYSFPLFLAGKNSAMFRISYEDIQPGLYEFWYEYEIGNTINRCPTDKNYSLYVES